MGWPNDTAARTVTVAFGCLGVLLRTGLAAEPPSAREREAFLDDLQQRTFRFFWETADPATNLVPDRWPSGEASSIAAVGFGLTAYTVGVERGWVQRPEAAKRVLETLRFFHESPQGPAVDGVAGYRGFYYHFLLMDSGRRWRRCELSSIDTALLMLGVLSAQQYFDGETSTESTIRELSDSLYRRVEWDWMQPRAPLVAMEWKPETGDFGPADYRGYNEAMFLYVLALGSPTHAIDPTAWEAFTADYKWAPYYGQAHVNFGPLFGHQYTACWIDPRGLLDPYLRARGIDYFENSRRATLAQRAYATDNPKGWRDYGLHIWGLTACDGPGNAVRDYRGNQRRFHTYWARGAAATEVRDDGTIAPTAAGGSMPFAPDESIAALMAMRRRYGDRLYGEYGFRDAFNPSVQEVAPMRGPGRVDPELGWFGTDYLGIDQGPILLMAENHRTRLVWDLMRSNPYLRAGLERAGLRRDQ